MYVVLVISTERSLFLPILFFSESDFHGIANFIISPLELERRCTAHDRSFAKQAYVYMYRFFHEAGVLERATIKVKL
jgi:hypothetical protein